MRSWPALCRIATGVKEITNKYYLFKTNEAACYMFVLTLYCFISRIDKSCLFSSCDTTGHDLKSCR
jgi:hypothetical protein